MVARLAERDALLPQAVLFVVGIVEFEASIV